MAQIKKKFIGDNQVGASKVRLENDSYLKARNAGNTADVDILKLNASNTAEVAVATNFASTLQVGGNAVATETFVTGELADYIPSSEKGASNGVATLDAGGKIPAAQLPNTVMEYQGTWNASTNSPTLADGTGNAGDVYIVSAAGSQDLGSGSISFEVGDWVIYNGATWEKSVNSNAVVSVNSQTGVVVLDTDDVGEGSTNLYFTNARAIAATLTGYAAGAGTVTSADSILTAIQKLDGNIQALPGGATWGKQSITLVAGDITNQYIDLAETILANSLLLVVDGIVQWEGTDYSVSLTGGAGGVTRVTFSGDLGTGGAAELIAGDIVRVQYQY